MSKCTLNRELRLTRRSAGSGHQVDLSVSDLSEERAMPATSVRDETRRLADQLPDDATWEDVLYQVYVRQSIEAGLEDVRAGRVVPADEVRRRVVTARR